MDDKARAQALFEEGFKIRRDQPAAAAAFFRQAAEMGNILAQHHLAQIWEEGQGVSQDFGEAVRWYAKAAERGYPQALTRLGDFYAAGHGVARDDAQAAAYYRQAAERGNADAQRALGLAYARGRGVEEDYQTAYAWLSCAAAQRAEAAQGYKSSVALLLSGEELAAAEMLAASYRRRYLRPRPAPEADDEA